MKAHSIESRVVNIYQPYVRTHRSWKDKAQVEFNAKLGVIIKNGYGSLHLRWEAYNKGSELRNRLKQK